MSKKILLSLITFFLVSTTILAQDFDDKLTDAKMAMMDGNFESGLTICKELIASGNADSTQLSEVYASAGMACEALKNNSEAVNYYAKAVEYRVPQLGIYDKLISLSKSEKNVLASAFMKAVTDPSDVLEKNLHASLMKWPYVEKLSRISPCHHRESMGSY